MKLQMRQLRDAIASVGSTDSKRRLPKRVGEAIANSGDVAEVLVKVIQLAVFSLWGLIYFAAPIPNPDTVSWVPVVISLYLLFTLVQLFIALNRRMPDWTIYLSIVIDISLLTALVWSFHIQYEQPASFSLKSVEVLNYFVLIALRTLRFEARYVMAAGFLATFGWILLTAYVVFGDPADSMITRDYITYITSNSVLIGAEISKILSLLTFTIILAVAVKRARNFLVESVTEASAADDLSRFMPDSVAEQIRQADTRIEAGDGVRREAAILNVDIRGFTQMVANLEPAAAMQMLADYQHHIVPIVHRHKGMIDKFMGDGIMITFGAVSSDDAYCANALRCCDEIIASPINLNTDKKSGSQKISELNINVAVTEGPVIFGAVGDGDRLELTVIGPAVNMSAKLEKFNKVMSSTALCTLGVFDRAREQGYTNPQSRPLYSKSIETGTDPIDIVVLA